MKRDPTQALESLSEVLNALPYPFMVIDVETYRVLMANPIALAGRELGTMTCHALSHMSPHPCEDNGFDCPLQRVKTTGQPTMVEHTHFDAAGRPRLVEVHAYPIRDEGGTVVRMIETVIDITARRSAELERERLIADLRGSIEQVKSLSGLLPICAQCKKIRDERGTWHALEVYLKEHTQAELTHGLCPSCAREAWPVGVHRPR